MNLLGLLHLNTAVVVAVMVSFVIPGLSALLARAHWPGQAVGALTLLLSTANGFFSEWSASPVHFAWKAAIGTAIVSYVLAVVSHYGIFKDTPLESWLRYLGSGLGKVTSTGPSPLAPAPVTSINATAQGILATGATTASLPATTVVTNAPPPTATNGS